MINMIHQKSIIKIKSLLFTVLIANFTWL